MSIIIKSDDEIAIMRQAGSIVAQTLQKLLAELRPGLVVKELDAIGPLSACLGISSAALLIPALLVIPEHMPSATSLACIPTARSASSVAPITRSSSAASASSSARSRLSCCRCPESARRSWWCGRIDPQAGPMTGGWWPM